jgi:hypothetical protein
MTNRPAIEKGLRKRIEDTKTWVKGHLGDEILDMKFRGKPARLKVIQFLNDDRVEANGVRFRLFFGQDTNQYFTDLDMRFNPNWVMAEGKDDTAPYLVVYVLDENGAGDPLKCFYFTDQDQLNEGLEMGEWYLSFINRAIRPGADGKIMIHRQEAGDS